MAVQAAWRGMASFKLCDVLRWVSIKVYQCYESELGPRDTDINALNIWVCLKRGDT